MQRFIILALVGLAAQLVDGSLGMAYGVTSSTLLVAAGLAPAAASASVHVAEIGTTLVSGVSHWRFGNLDWRIIGRIALPGAVGAVAGATFLSTLSTDIAAPWMAGILLVLGAYILVRFAGSAHVLKANGAPPRTPFLVVLGTIAGFVDSTGGGGWGPVATPALLASRRVEPRKAVGSVDASEFIVSVAASVGFVVALGNSVLDLTVIAGLLVGGVIAAPIAAWLVRLVPMPVLGSSVGGIIVLTNARTLMNVFSVQSSVSIAVYAVVAAAWVIALAIAVRTSRRVQVETRRAGDLQHDARSAVEAS